VRGTLGAPYLDGTVLLKTCSLSPASTLIIPEGKIYFAQQNPFMPVVDVRATSEVPVTTSRWSPFGPINRRSHAAIRSSAVQKSHLPSHHRPTPAGMSARAFGEAAAWQGGIILCAASRAQLGRWHRSQ